MWKTYVKLEKSKHYLDALTINRISQLENQTVNKKRSPSLHFIKLLTNDTYGLQSM